MPTVGRHNSRALCQKVGIKIFSKLHRNFKIFQTTNLINHRLLIVSKRKTVDFKSIYIRFQAAADSMVSAPALLDCNTVTASSSNAFNLKVLSRFLKIFQNLNSTPKQVNPDAPTDRDSIIMFNKHCLSNCFT